MQVVVGERRAIGAHSAFREKDFIRLDFARLNDGELLCDAHLYGAFRVAHLEVTFVFGIDCTIRVDFRMNVGTGGEEGVVHLNHRRRHVVHERLDIVDFFRV